MRAPSTQARRRRIASRRGRSLPPALWVVVGTLVLFAMSLGANRVDQLQQRRTKLERELAYHQDELRRLTASYLKASSRERIVPRAKLELAMVEPDFEEKWVLTLPSLELGIIS